MGGLMELSTKLGATALEATKPEIQLDGTAITLFEKYEDVALRGLHSQDEFELRFGHDPRGRIWYSATPEDSSMHTYRPLEIYREELRATHLEKIIVDTVQTYFNHQNDLSCEAILGLNAEFYRTLRKDLLGEA